MQGGFNLLDRLKKVIGNSEQWTEIRYHSRDLTSIEIKNGEVTKTEATTLAGAGIRCLVDGCWGFAATADVSEDGLKQALKEAAGAARTGSSLRKKKIDELATGKPARGEFNYTGGEEEPGLAEKISKFLEAEEYIRKNENMVAGIIRYSRYDDQKIIVTTDGVEAKINDLKQDIGISAVGRGEEGQEIGSASAGVTGTWQELFSEKSLSEMVEEAVNIARTKLSAAYAQGGEYTVILDPMLVGVLAHEAIGHTVEADFVMSGSIVQDKIGEKVASEKVTMIDDGTVAKTAGMTLVDDEGMSGQKTVIIEDGILKNYLHNRESAAEFDTEPRGNARAFTYRDEPLIRMTNTYIKPGKSSFEEMVSGIEEGYYLKGLGQGGQADANAEFMFGVQEAYKIENGKITEPVKGITISGQAFSVLNSVDAVGDDLKFALGRGYCGKGQPAKVDAGGPHLRCQVKIGGKQEGEK